MRTRIILHLIMLAFFFQSLGAEELKVTHFRNTGPFPVKTPMMLDSLNVKSKPFSFKDMLEDSFSLVLPSDAPYINGEEIPGAGEEYSIGLASFLFETRGQCKVGISVESGAESYVVYLDGHKALGETSLSPGTHETCIRYLLSPHDTPSLKATLKTSRDGQISLREDGKHLYGMKDVLLGTRLSGVSISPSGNYMIVSYTRTLEGGRATRYQELVETATGKVLSTHSDRISWMPVSDKYYITRREASGNRLVAVDPGTGEETTLGANIPEGMFTISPTEDFLIYSRSEEGPREKEDIYQILSPDDRQPGWRSRSYPVKYDLSTGESQRLTWGHHNSRIYDISADGKKALLMVNEERLEKRPTTVSTLYLLDLGTLEASKLVEKDGFMQGAMFSPDAAQVLLTGSPEAFDAVGMNVDKGQTPNTYDIQLFMMDLSSKKIRPLTKNFDPSVQTVRWSPSDGNIYFTAEDKDYLRLFRMDPKNGKITSMDASEDMVNGFSVARSADKLVYYGQGAMNSDRLYVLDTRSRESTLMEDLSSEILRDVELGECREWNFNNSKGETVYGRFYLPPHFDPGRKYPMIVNYYGGCSPTGRNFESRYPHHAYAALGYVVYVVSVPSGATGNGQKWSARHVNTAGDGPAQDIIEGTEKFIKEHSFVDKEHVGCIGASYGGFMSQYLPTLTDMFACSISHAGISDHTSYWGFGYWGYSYSETSMANSYPWSDRELYVDHSPLYLADKINTPILLIHGDADTNVPFNESIQMFTALKLLGKETALVAVKDQNHHILDYSKRLQWQNTIWAWFAKYLKDDPSWWDSLYPEKNL